jgi:hypothetical protein
MSRRGGHSAYVNMELLVNGHSLSVDQMGPDFVLVAAPINQPPSEASLLLQVDEIAHRWNVNLPLGISADTKRIKIAPSLAVEETAAPRRK